MLTDCWQDSCWFMLRGYITMHGQQKTLTNSIFYYRFFKCVLLFLTYQEQFVRIKITFV